MENAAKFKHFIISLLAVTVLTALSVYATPWPANNSLGVASFNKLVLEGAFEVTLIQGAEESVTINKGDKESGDQIIAKSENETLKISTRKHENSSGKIELIIKFKNLNAIYSSGATTITGTEILKFDELNFDASGACKVSLEIEAANLNVDISGAGNINLKGKVSKVSLNISGSGKFLASELRADAYKIDITGAGKTEINATKLLDVHVSGSGKVKYTGDPKINSEISGAGSVAKL